MLETRDILETINMIDNENLDVRTITMGISLLDCIDEDIDKACTKVYDKICRNAKDLVKTGEDIQKEFGIPIIHKRISVTPIGMVAAPCQSKNVVKFAHTLDKAAKELGVNFIGGYSALVQKGFASGDYALIESIPQALSETDFVCSSVNIGSTKAGINMDAVKMMGKVVKQAAEVTADRNCIGAAKLVVFCNAPEDNPFMAGAFHGVGEADTVINVGVSVMASSHVGGLSGAFIPVSEDAGMIHAATEGYLDITKLESMTAVCSVGLDMIVVPGDITPEVISAIIADEAAIGMVNTKTTAVRLIPAIGKSAGEELNFGGLLGRGPVMPVRKGSPEAFIKRGGRIPAPLQALKN